MSDFYQTPPELSNCYTDDIFLQKFLQWKLDANTYKEIQPEWTQFGERVSSELCRDARQAEKESPIHIPYDPWGKRVDVLKLSPAWDRLKAAAAEEGLVAMGYERKYGPMTRLVQMSKQYLYHPSSAFFSCPLAMADGAAKAIELYAPEKLKAAYQRLTSRDAKTFWTSGQWMTEKTGGSDVSGTSTVAKPNGDNYRLYGTKWFSSSTASEMALTLGRIEGDPDGSRGLSMFYLEVYDKNNALNGIHIHRLKDKLGTKALPTAELSLEGTQAQLLGERGHGVKSIATMLNITRMYNAICAVAQSQRAFQWVKDYSHKRSAFGSTIDKKPLHLETLIDIKTEISLGFMLSFYVAELMGKDEANMSTDEEKLMYRFLTPIAKLTTAKQAIAISSECLEAIGGAGYVEDTNFPHHLRDSQVFPIWEGTTNVLSLDVLRVASKHKEVFPVFLKQLKSRLQLSGMMNHSHVKMQFEQLSQAIEHLAHAPEKLETSARWLSLSAGRLFAFSLLAEFAHESQWDTLQWLMRRACQKQLVWLPTVDRPEDNQNIFSV